MKVKDMSFGKKTSANDIVRQMKDSGGFVAKELGTAVDILEKMMGLIDRIATMLSS